MEEREPDEPDTNARNAAPSNPGLVAGLIFVLLFVSYGWFVQGGGWNQNARFAQVRSLAEQGSFVANPYVAYTLVDPANPASLTRIALPDRAPPPPDPRLLATLDLTYFEGRFFPNKPPGASMLAAPGYALVAAVERGLGVDLDGWFVVGLNAHLAGLLSVGIFGALAGVWVFAISRRLFPDAPTWSHAATALTSGLATLCFPFATLLMDHVLVASLALAAFALLEARRPRPAATGALVAAGVVCGVMVLVNYTAFLLVLVLGVYALWRVCPPREPRPLRVGWLALGGLPLAIFLAWYHQEFFGGVLETANSHQPEFMNESAPGTWLGMIGIPDPVVAWRLLFSAYRGLFVSSPILLIGVVCLVRALRSRAIRAEAVVCSAMFAVMWILNASFNGWHGGHSFGARYLIPGIPFLALPLTWSFVRRPFLTSGVAALSCAIMLLATAVSPQVPSPIENPWQDFMLPLAGGDSLLLGREQHQGPLSTNPIAVYEGGAHRLFPPGSPQSKWSSFNLGELVWPGSWWSLLPLLGFWAAGLLAILHAAGWRAGTATQTQPATLPGPSISGIPVP